MIASEPGEEREADPGMILEAAVLDRIDGDLECRHRGGKPVEHRAEPLALLARPRWQIELGQRRARPRRRPGG